MYFIVNLYANNCHASEGWIHRQPSLLPIVFRLIQIYHNENYCG